jgi:hypothetical protein
MGVYRVLSRRQAFKNSLTGTAASLYYRTEKTKDGRVTGTRYCAFFQGFREVEFEITDC